MAIIRIFRPREIIEEITYLELLGLDLKPVKRALIGLLRPSTSGYLSDENGPRGVSASGCLQGLFPPALGPAL